MLIHMLAKIEKKPDNPDWMREMDIFLLIDNN